MTTRGETGGVNRFAHEVNVPREVLEMSKKDLENSKKALEKLTILIPRHDGEKRDAWFWRAGNMLGIASARLKSLYYDPRCRMWAHELDTIQRKQRELLNHQLAALRVRQGVIAERLQSLGELHNAETSRQRRPARDRRHSRTC